MTGHVLAIDQGTTSTRAMIVDSDARRLGFGQVEHGNSFPRPGWVEQDPREIWANTRAVIASALASARLRGSEIAAVGITNQRETAILWDRRSGDPVHPAIVWQDTRTQVAVDALAAQSAADRIAHTGLPLSTYFSATKIAWLLDHVEGARDRATRGELIAGTVDSWLLWWLTGGPHGGLHATDVTNASRTSLVDLATLDWDPALLELFRIPRAALPRIVSSSEILGVVSTVPEIAGVPVSGILGDQQAALFGHGAFGPGEAKATYGTGCFVLVGTGTQIPRSAHGLISTVAYRLGDASPQYALEGSIGVAGALVQWFRDDLRMIADTAEFEELAASVPDSGGAYIVPAFSGLLSPHWRPDARGTIVGLTRYVGRAQLARAALDATAFQVHDIITAVECDTGSPIRELRVDGGMVENSVLLQVQADVLGIPVRRAAFREVSALGAAFAAGLAVGVWGDLDDVRSAVASDGTWHPAWSPADRTARLTDWDKAVGRALDWI